MQQNKTSINNKQILINRLFLCIIPNIIAIMHVKCYDADNDCFDADILWSNSIDNDSIIKGIFLACIRKNLFKEIQPEQIDILVHCYNLKKINNIIEIE